MYIEQVPVGESATIETADGPISLSQYRKAVKARSHADGESSSSEKADRFPKVEDILDRLNSRTEVANDRPVLKP